MMTMKLQLIQEWAVWEVWEEWEEWVILTQAKCKTSWEVWEEWEVEWVMIQMMKNKRVKLNLIYQKEVVLMILMEKKLQISNNDHENIFEKSPNLKYTSAIL